METKIIKTNQVWLKIKAHTLLILTAICWGMNVVLGQLAIGEVSPLAIVMLRWGGVLILLLVFFRKNIILDWPMLRQRYLYMIVMGGVGYTGFNSLYYVAAHSTSAVNIGILQGAIPVFIVLGAFFVFNNEVSKTQFIGILATFFGVLVVGTEGSYKNLARLNFKFGDLLMIVACIFYAGYALGLRMRPKSSALSLFAGMAGAAFLSSIPLVITEFLLGQFYWPTLKGWAIVSLIILFPSFLAQIFFMKGVDVIGPSRAGAFANLVPIFGAVFSVAILSEKFSIFHGVALIFVLGGILISELSRK